MKKLRIFALAAFAAISMSATAQVTYGNDYQYKPEKSSSYGSDIESFSTLYFQFNPSKMRVSYDGYSASESYTGLTLGYSYSLPLLSSNPLYLEFGGAAQWFFKSHEGAKFNMIAVKIPIDVMYSFDVSDAVSIQPYAGIYGRFNIMAKTKYDGETIDMFKKEDVGDPWKRFQLGWQAGCKFRFAHKITVGAGYYMDFMKITDHTTVQGFDITLGLNF